MVPLYLGTKVPSPHLGSVRPCSTFLLDGGIFPHQDHRPPILPSTKVLIRCALAQSLPLSFFFPSLSAPFVISLAAPNIKIGGKRAQKRLLRRRDVVSRLRVPRRARARVGVGVGGAGETGDCRQQPGLRLQDVSVIICDISLSRMVKPVPSTISPFK